MHSSDKVYEIELLNINHDYIQFITKKDINKAKNCTLSIQRNDYLDQNILLILNNDIIAYGILY